MSAELPPDTVKYPQDLSDRAEYPGMVRWFSPEVLLTTGRKALVSGLFGQYADSRLIHASLDPVNACEITSRCDFAKRLAPGADGAVWIDYVVDLGDGFDSTYAIAYLLGQKSLDIKGVGTLPRGQALIMGGDQVYPEATRDNYKKRMLNPYAFAFPDSDAPDAVHPPLFLIPGNHDWYDGLVLFLGMFCTGRDKKVGSWRAVQRRSYFAIALSENWWIWGFDSQLGEDIDQPQADYFVSLAKCMPESPKIIICAPVPTWLRSELSARNPEQRESFYRGLNYIAHNIAKNNCTDSRICAVLSGDMHHYSRYAGQGPQFITAGGGGAFLHPTHQLPTRIDMGWMGQTQYLSLETEPGADHAPAPGNPACYPKPNVSRRLLLRNLAFPLVNFSFAVSLGIVYWIVALLLTAGRNDAAAHPADGWEWGKGIFLSMFFSPAFWIVFAVLVVVLWIYANAQTAEGKWALGISHAAAHMGVILALVGFLPVANTWMVAHTAIGKGLPEWLLPGPVTSIFLRTFPPPINVSALIYTWIGRGLPGWFLPGTLSYFFLFAAETILIGGLAGGFIWGVYLLLTCGISGIHDNDAFSAMRLGRYRHFLRLCIRGDDLTIYPIAIDRPPSRSGWQWNPARKKGNQNQPEVIPRQQLKPHLIEGPVVIVAPKPRKKPDPGAKA